MRRRDRSPPRLFQSNLVCNTRLTIKYYRRRTNTIFKKMIYITGFIVALVLALFVIAWIAFCMFVREKHKSEFYHHNISDIQRRNVILQQAEEISTDKKEKDISVGVFVLPSRHKQKDEDYNKRPDYPESPIPISHPSTDKLIQILNDEDADVHYRDGIYEVDGPIPYDSEV